MNLPPGYEYLASFDNPLVAIVCVNSAHRDIIWAAAFFGKLHDEWTRLGRRRITGGQNGDHAFKYLDDQAAVDIDTKLRVDVGHNPPPPPHSRPNATYTRDNIRCDFRVRGRECGQAVAVREERIQGILENHYEDYRTTHPIVLLTLPALAAKLRS